MQNWDLLYTELDIFVVDKHKVSLHELQDVSNVTGFVQDV
jgi:hypothetical protein